MTRRQVEDATPADADERDPEYAATIRRVAAAKEARGEKEKESFHDDYFYWYFFSKLLP